MAAVKAQPGAAAFRRTVLAHFRKHGRADLPWRHTSDPYAIIVSELMLQQTQVPRVVEKYREFMRRFPTVRTLAAAPLPSVLAAWSGLGYNRRAKFLHELARVVVSEHGGRFPDTVEGLERLPGIGPYTARAVCAFAYNQPVSLVETNVRTAFIHHFFPDRDAVSDRELSPYIDAALDRKNPRQWYAALMDYGTHLKQSGNRAHRKSAHYVRQAAFAGSRRQLRGRIIRSLLQSPKGVAVLVRESERTPDEVRAAIGSLLREGLVARQGRRYALAGQR